MNEWAESVFQDWLVDNDLEPDEETLAVLRSAFIAGAEGAAAYAKYCVLNDFCAPSSEADAYVDVGEMIRDGSWNPPC